MQSHEISNKIKKMRGALTQAEFANKTGINRSLINQYESGDRTPSLCSLGKLADYGKVTVDYLLGRDDAPTHKLNKEEELIINLCRKLPTDTRQLVVKLIEKLNNR